MEEPLNFKANDWFYMKTNRGDVCYPSSTTNKDLCKDNQTAVNILRDSNNNLGANVTQYNDSKMLYNRELLFTINILFGIALICYYIYVNKSAIPSPSEAAKTVGTMSESIGNIASSVKSKLSMTPPQITTK
jgi:hypothetical protein